MFFGFVSFLGRGGGWGRYRWKCMLLLQIPLPEVAGTDILYPLSCPLILPTLCFLFSSSLVLSHFPTSRNCQQDEEPVLLSHGRPVGRGRRGSGVSPADGGSCA